MKTSSIPTDIALYAVNNSTDTLFVLSFHSHPSDEVKALVYKKILSSKVKIGERNIFMYAVGFSDERLADLKRAYNTQKSFKI